MVHHGASVRWVLTPFEAEVQVSMSKPGKTVAPKAGDKERKLLQVKYDVFHESIRLQHKIKRDVEWALA
jgi:hypothetical protein